MWILLTATTGVVGRHPLPQLQVEGHNVIACPQDNAEEEALRASGAQPCVVNALDGGATVNAVCKTQPHVVIHQLTALAGVQSCRDMDCALTPTNLLRTVGLYHLLESERLADASRSIANSYGGWSMKRVGGRTKTESDPLKSHVPLSWSKPFPLPGPVNANDSTLSPSIARDGALYFIRPVKAGKSSTSAAHNWNMASTPRRRGSASAILAPMETSIPWWRRTAHSLSSLSRALLSFSHPFSEPHRFDHFIV